MSAMNDHARLLSSAIATSRLRLLPFLVLMYVLAFIDRANVGYARAFLQADTGLGDAAFAFGASIFFIGYACFEVPSNLMLHRLGARVWLCRIMVTWGLVSAAMMFADDAMTFYVLRFLLGVAEAGFFPGIILYLTYWFPQRSRAQALGLFYFGLPLALVLGGPLSGWLLEFHGIFGLANWQWLFVTEGLLASLVGIAAYFYLVDRPRDAGWLSDEQKRALEGELAEEDTRKQARGPHGFLSALRSGQVLKFCLVYFTIQMSVYGVVFYLPTRIASFLDGQVGLNVGLITAIPWVCALVVTRLVTRQADRSGQHRQLAVAGRSRHRRLGAGRQPGPGGDRLLLRRVRLRLGAAAVLDPSHRLPERCGRGQRHRPDQLPGQPRRLCRAEPQDPHGKPVRRPARRHVRPGRRRPARRLPAGPAEDLRIAVRPAASAAGRLTHTTHR